MNILIIGIDKCNMYQHLGLSFIYRSTIISPKDVSNITDMLVLD